MRRARFPAMGTRVEVTARFASDAAAPGADQLTAALRALVGDIEGQLSRFLEDSDVARLVRAGGAWIPVGEHTWAVMGAAERLRAATEGLFDPAPRGRRLDRRPEADEARLTSPGGLDFGAIGKGYAADQVSQLCRDLGATAVLAAAGTSSISVWAEPGAPVWRIGLRSPGGARDESLGVLELRTGAVSTSSEDERPGHLVDPRTGRAAASELVQATVVAPDGMTAEACSTALMIGGTASAARLTDRIPDAAAILVTRDAVLVSPALRGAFQPLNG